MYLGKTPSSNALQNWDKIFDTELRWEKIFKKVKNIKEVKLKWFQMKICYRILVTNSILKEMNVVNENLCNFCKIEKDTILHYLWQCPHVQLFWKALEELLLEKTNQQNGFEISRMLALFGSSEETNTDDGMDFILLHAKFFVYKCRLNKIKPCMQHFLKYLKYQHKIDQYASRIEMNYVKVHLKWLPYVEIFK